MISDLRTRVASNAPFASCPACGGPATVETFDRHRPLTGASERVRQVRCATRRCSAVSPLAEGEDARPYVAPAPRAPVRRPASDKSQGNDILRALRDTLDEYELRQWQTSTPAATGAPRKRLIRELDAQERAALVDALQAGEPTSAIGERFNVDLAGLSGLLRHRAPSSPAPPAVPSPVPEEPTREEPPTMTETRGFGPARREDGTYDPDLKRRYVEAVADGALPVEEAAELSQIHLPTLRQYAALERRKRQGPAEAAETGPRRAAGRRTGKRRKKKAAIGRPARPAAVKTPRPAQDGPRVRAADRRRELGRLVQSEDLALFLSLDEPMQARIRELVLADGRD
jgi:hypothetical protein